MNAHCTLRRAVFSFTFVFSLIATARAFEVNENRELECAQSYSFLAPVDSSDNRKYAPDRAVDILHLLLDVTPDFKQRTVAGTATFTFKPIAKPLEELRLDAVDLSVNSVTSTENISAYQVTEKEIVVTFATPVPVEKDTRVTIAYHAEPTEGLYFRTAEMGYPAGDTQIYTQGESIEARH